MFDIADRLGPIARELLSAWSLLPAQDCVPNRADFDPMTIPRILPVISVLQRRGDDAWCFRVAGTEVERRWARHLTGLNYFDIDFVSPQAKHALRQEFRQIAEWPCGSWSRRRVAFASRRCAAIETLRLPLRNSDGRVGLIVSCSEEFPDTGTALVDAPREIINITEREYLDIGARCPPRGALAGGVHPEPTEFAA